MLKTLLKFYILYRIPIIIALIVFGIISHIYLDTVLAWLCYIGAAISIALYLLIGTMRLVQEAITEGDVEGAVKYLNMIKYPQFLFKPVRQAYYTVRSQLALASDDLESAEGNIRKSLKSNSSLIGEMKGTNLMQLGFIQLRQGNPKEARKNLLEAVRAGIPDKDSLAATYLQLCSIEIQRNQNKVAKEFFRRAKAQNSRSEEVVKQIKAMEKQISRMPG